MQQKTRLWVVLAACVAVIPLHCVELYFFTEPTTGFYKTAGVWPRLFCALCILAAVAVALFIKSGTPKEARHFPAGGWFLPALAWVNALVLTFEVYTIAAAGKMATAQGVFTVLAAIFFGCCGTFYGQSKAMPLLTRFFALPLVALRLIAEFLSTKGMAITAEHVYDLCLRCLMLVAYAALAKVMCEIELQKNIRNLVGWGAAAAMLATLCTLPACILSLLGGAAAVHGSSLPLFSDFFMGVFPLLYGLKMLSMPKIVAAQPAQEATPAVEEVDLGAEPVQEVAEEPPVEEPTQIQE